MKPIYLLFLLIIMAKFFLMKQSVLIIPTHSSNYVENTNPIIFNPAMKILLHSAAYHQCPVNRKPPPPLMNRRELCMNDFLTCLLPQKPCHSPDCWAPLNHSRDIVTCNTIRVSLTKLKSLKCWLITSRLFCVTLSVENWMERLALQGHEEKKQ